MAYEVVQASVVCESVIILGLTVWRARVVTGAGRVLFECQFNSPEYAKDKCHRWIQRQAYEATKGVRK